MTVLPKLTLLQSKLLLLEHTYLYVHVRLVTGTSSHVRLVTGTSSQVFWNGQWQRLVKLIEGCDNEGYS